MEWRVDGSRNRLDRPPSACRSLPIQQARFREQGLWSILTILSLFAGTVMASSETALGSMGSVSSASMEENSMETPSLAVWNHWHGENMTMQDLSTSELLRAERSPSGSSSIRRSSRRAGGGGRSRSCRLRSHPINVRDLGLGYDSEEVVLFRYCSGTCRLARTDYHEVLNHLVRQGIIVPKHNDYISQPCCQPIRYENLSFLDAHNVWQNLQDISAAECSCRG
ncbi:artemin [Crotalus tigris]|uniref:artemin n=1 Tax=Crotalus tigris TaxID=88082 RepID=UPI00192FA840|nr:artemin [Crotalus tigris]XP_039179256.1 artemin [Crotalus tigris]XP_039179257.1 artemin [Crotalus tigris]